MRSFILSVCLILCLESTVHAVEVPAVPVIADAEAFAVVVVPELKAALVRLDQALAAAKLPVPSGLIARQLGAAIGDPTLAGLGAGPIAFAAAPGAPMPAWCVIVPLPNPAVLQRFAAGGNVVIEAVPGGVALGSPVGGLELAKRLVPGLPALAKAIPAGTDFRVLVAGDRLARTYLSLALGSIQMAMTQSAAASGKPAGPEQQRAVQAATTAVRLFLQQSGSLCVDVSSGAKGWTVDVLAAPAPGAIADSLKPLPVAAGADLGARLGAGVKPQLMAVIGRFPPALNAGMARLVESARKDPAIAAMVDESLVKAMDGLAKSIDGRLAMRQGVDFQMLCAMGVSDAAGLRQANASTMALCGKGFFADMLASAGLRMKSQRAVRRSGAVEVDRMVYELIPGALPPVQAEMMQEMLKPVEMAVDKDVFAIGGPAADLDSLLAGTAAKPLVLQAQALPGQWDLRADWDLALQMKCQVEMMHFQNEKIPPMFTNVKGGVPVRLGVAFGAGRVRALAEVPAGLIAQLAAMWMGAMGGGMHAAPAAELPSAPAPKTF
jgi:hypothetical protein